MNATGLFSEFKRYCYDHIIEACSRYNMAIPAPGSDVENLVYWIYSGHSYGDLGCEFSVPEFQKDRSCDDARHWTDAVIARISKLAVKACIANGYSESRAQKLVCEYMYDIMHCRYYSDSRDQFMLTVFRDLQAVDIEGYSENTHITAVLLG